MSFGGYALGLLGLVAVVTPAAYTGLRLRARFMPGWSGAPARLVETVVAISVFTILLQLLGAVGLLSFAPLVLASLAVGFAAHRWARPDEGADASAPPLPQMGRLAVAVSLVAAVFLVTHWTTGLQGAWGGGMLTFDTLWYHGPFSARAAAEGSIWGLHFTDPVYLNWFYPQNSELQHAAGIVLLGRDLASPLFNFGWLGLALLGAWCIGRPYGVAPLSMIAVALVMDAGFMIPRETGTLANDVAPAALLLAAVAILVNAWAGHASGPGREATGGTAPRGAEAGGATAGGSRAGAPKPEARGPIGAAIVVAGVAVGLALGTKLTIAGPAAAMLAGVPLLVAPGWRRRAFLLFAGGVAATCGFWFLRNLIHSGTPLPWLQSVGPIDLPGPARGLEGRDPYSVSHYIFENPDGAIWRDRFFPGIKNLFGPAWPAFFGLTAVGCAVALRRPRSTAIRLAGVVAIVGVVTYLFTPLTAAGPDGDPRAFTINLRYLLPALAVALAILPLESRLTPPRWRATLACGGLATLLVTAFYSDSAAIWDEPSSSIPAAIVIAVLMVGIPLGIAKLARRSGSLGLVAGAAALLVVGAAGWNQQDDYFAGRYANDEDFRFELDEAVSWAKDTEGLRIGVAGTSGAYSQYGFYGDKLENEVQFIGVTGPAGDFREAGNCADWREAANAGDYDYVIVTPSLDLNAPDDAGASPERGWIEGVGAPEPNAEKVAGASRVGVYRIEGPLSAEGCRKDVGPAGEDGGPASEDNGPGKSERARGQRQ